MKGGVYLLKQHVARIPGNVRPCQNLHLRWWQRQRQRQHLIRQNGINKRKQSRRKSRDGSSSVKTRARLKEEADIARIRSKTPREFGAIHCYVSFLPGEPTTEVNGKMKQAITDEVERK